MPYRHATSSLEQLLAALSADCEPTGALQQGLAQIGEGYSLDRVWLVGLADSQACLLQAWTAPTIPEPPCAASVELLWPQERASWQQGCPFRAVPPVASPGKAWARSRLSVPLFLGSSLLGGLVLEQLSDERPFSASERQQLAQLAPLLALVAVRLQNAERMQALAQQQQRARQDKQAQSESIAGLAHELREPLTNVTGFAKLLRQQVGGTLSERQRQYVQSLVDSSEYLLQLLEDLIEFAKLEADRTTLAWETVPVEQACRQALSLVRARADSQGLQLPLAIDPRATACRADRKRLQQILVNLLSNAVKYTPAGSVTIEVTPAHGWIAFAVIDTGIGIPPSEREAVFQPFRQGQSQDRARGTGLGLSLARRLARLHGGDITLDSQQGKGSRFTLYLPHAATGEAG